MIAGQAFLFGKMPAIGDFVVRGLGEARRAAWDDRCTASLHEARRRFGDDLAMVMDGAPPRGFLLSPMPDEPCWQAGCIAPSCDRAGRSFPLVLGIAVGDGWSVPAAAIARRLLPVLRAAIACALAPDRAIAAVAPALATPGDNEPVEMLAPWRDDWIEAVPMPPGGQGKQ